MGSLSQALVEKERELGEMLVNIKKQVEVKYK